MRRVALNPGIPSGRWARLRKLCGHDEASVDGTGPGEAIALLDRLFVEESGTAVVPGSACRLPISDVDRLLASVYQCLFDDRIEATIACERCEKGFELVFSLQDLVDRALAPDTGGIEGPVPEEGAFWYRLPGGIRFRLPTALDQRAVMDLPEREQGPELIRRCVGDVSTPEELGRVVSAMERVGPVLRLDLDATCAECGKQQAARFDIESFFMKALVNERRWLLREAHTLAMAYRWSRAEILGLPRDERRTYVALVGAERGTDGKALFS